MLVSALDIRTSENDSVKTFHVTGEIRGPQIVALCKKLEAVKKGSCKRVVVDLSAVNYIDSSGLGGLIYSRKLLEKSDIELCLAAPQGYIATLFRDCAFHKIFSIIEPG